MRAANAHVVRRDPVSAETVERLVDEVDLRDAEGDLLAPAHDAVDDVRREHGLAEAGWRLQDRTLGAGLDRLTKVIEGFDLPVSQLKQFSHVVGGSLV